MAEKLDQFDPCFDCFVFAVGGDMNNTAATAMGFRSTQTVHVDVFTGYGSHDFRSGNKNSTGRAKNHYVGQRRAVGRASCCWAKHN